MSDSNNAVYFYGDNCAWCGAEDVTKAQEARVWDGDMNEEWHCNTCQRNYIIILKLVPAEAALITPGRVRTYTYEDYTHILVLDLTYDQLPED